METLSNGVSELCFTMPAVRAGTFACAPGST
jgi:hypothetical protein